MSKSNTNRPRPALRIMAWPGEDEKPFLEVLGTGATTMKRYRVQSRHFKLPVWHKSKEEAIEAWNEVVRVVRKVSKGGVS